MLLRANINMSDELLLLIHLLNGGGIHNSVIHQMNMYHTLHSQHEYSTAGYIIHQSYGH